MQESLGLNLPFDLDDAIRSERLFYRPRLSAPLHKTGSPEAEVNGGNNVPITAAKRSA